MPITQQDMESVATVAAGSFGALLVLAYPLMKLVRMWNVDSKANTKDSAESTLYEHLSDQVEILSKNLEKSREDADKLVTEVATLKNRVITLEGHEAANVRLREKLDRKDEEMRDAMRKVYQANKEIEQLKNSLSRYETIKTDFADLPLMMAEDFKKKK